MYYFINKDLLPIDLDPLGDKSFILFILREAVL